MPWVAIAGLALAGTTATVSGVSAASAAAKRKKAERALENLKSPTYSPNQSILDYYSKALQKYETGVTDSAEYKMRKQEIGQGVVQGISNLQDRRLGGAGIANLIQGQNNALLKAAVAGEQRKAHEFNVLGQATQMKTGEEKAAFQQNYLYPFEMKYNLLARKAAGYAAAQNSAMQNMYNSGLSGLSYGSSIGGGGGNIGGGGSGGGGGSWVGLSGGRWSDKRMKHNYHVVGKSPSGINIYEFSYKGSDERYQGVMSEEVPQASFISESGYFMVDYSKIDVVFKRL